MSRTFTRGRVDAASDSEAAELVWAQYPDAIVVTIIGPTPDRRWEYVVEMNA